MTRSCAEWVRRHTSYGDFNGDGVADRVVALSWPEEGEIVRDIGSTTIWQDPVDDAAA